MSDKQSIWARQAFHDLISRAAENGPHLDEDSAAPLMANIGAMKALCGASDAPSADIAALLRSEHPIEPEVREALARALEGIAPIRLEVVGLSYGKEARRRHGLSINLQRGRSAIQLMAALGYNGAIDATAREAGVSNKTIVANVAFARKVDAWIDAALAADKSLSEFSRIRLEYVYLDATHGKSDPDDLLAQSVAAWRERGQVNFNIA